MANTKNYGFYVETQFAEAMELDRAHLSEALGVTLNFSQYIRYVLNERIQVHPPAHLGYREGALAAYVEVKAALDATMGHLLARARTDG